MLFEVRRRASSHPVENGNPGCGRRLYSKFSHHWGIACPNRTVILVRLKRRDEAKGNDNRTNEGHSRLCSRRRGKELYRGGGTYRSVEVGGGQKRPAPRGPVRRPPAAANDTERLADRARVLYFLSAASASSPISTRRRCRCSAIRKRPAGGCVSSLPVSFGRLHVLPIVNQFMSKWPEISVNVSFNDRFVDLIDEGIDLAIELGGSDDSRLMTRLLAPHRLVTCASPAYLKSHGVPTNIEELACHSCLAFVHGGRPGDWRFSIDGHIRAVAVNGRFSSTNAEALRDATLAGYGIARLATFLISDDLRSARLLPVLNEYSTDGPAVRAVYPSSRHLSPKVRSFIDELLTAWRPEPPWDRP